MCDKAYEGQYAYLHECYIHNEMAMVVRSDTIVYPRTMTNEDERAVNLS